jgi:uncharacterized delta-60 repeat protein
MGSQYVKIATATSLILALVLLSGIAGAAGGQLDPSFDGDGWTTTDLGGNDEVNDVAVQNDGRIVAAGLRSDDFGLVRYNSDGSLDTSFGDSGMVGTDFGGYDENALAVALQADGKIVVVGSSSLYFAVARYNSNGTLDTSFGDHGSVITDFGVAAAPRDVAIQSDGKIVVVGASVDGGGSVGFALARYTTDGSLDPSFGGDGQVTTDFGRAALADGVALQADGKIVAAGYSGRLDSDASDFALARYNADGSLDRTFGTSGMVITDLGGVDYAVEVAIHKDGRIVAAGASRSSSGRVMFAVARYHRKGTLDNSFSGDGRTVEDAGANLIVHAMTLQDDAKAILAGSRAVEAPGSPQRPILVRIGKSGLLDSTFDGDGRLMLDHFDSTWAEARAVTMQSDGRIFVGGVVGGSFLAVRLLGRWRDLHQL